MTIQHIIRTFAQKGYLVARSIQSNMIVVRTPLNGIPSQRLFPSYAAAYRYYFGGTK